jgi:hypothetical protein
MQASNATHKLSPASTGGCICNKVIKCDKKEFQLPLAPTDPWRGLGAEPPHQGSLVGAKSKKYTQNKIEIFNHPHLIIGDLSTL